MTEITSEQARKLANSHVHTGTDVAMICAGCEKSDAIRSLANQVEEERENLNLQILKSEILRRRLVEAVKIIKDAERRGAEKFKAQVVEFLETNGWNDGETRVNQKAQAFAYANVIRALDIEAKDGRE
jgi:hypothetical protein